MTHTRINPPALFDSTRYGFAQVVVATGRRTVYCSGQVAWDANEDIGSAGMGEQARRALANVERAVVAAGGGLADVVSLRLYIVRQGEGDMRAIREALLAAFPAGAQPATTWIVVAGLANPDFAIEIEAVAVLD